MTTAEALAYANYRPAPNWTRCHCSNCRAYVSTTKAGEGRCVENEGAAVHFQAICDKWKGR